MQFLVEFYKSPGANHTGVKQGAFTLEGHVLQSIDLIGQVIERIDYDEIGRLIISVKDPIK